MPSRTYTLSFACASLLLMAGIAYAATVPANVRSVQGVIANGKLTVTWDYPTDAPPPAFFRVYWSRRSILGNNGDYDDFAQTTGPETSYTFPGLPLSSPTIVLGVLAVQADGTESEGFETETTVTISAGEPSSAQSSAPTVAANPPLTPLPPVIVAAADPFTDTGVLLTVNKPLIGEPSLTPAGFTVTDTGGTAIAVVTARLADATHILLVTARQKPDTMYIVTVVEPVIALDGSTSLPNVSLPFRSLPAFTTTVPTPAAEHATKRPYGKNPALIAVAATEPTQTATTTELPGSGVGIIGIAVASGVMAGFRRKKRMART